MLADDPPRQSGRGGVDQCAALPTRNGAAAQAPARGPGPRSAARQNLGAGRLRKRLGHGLALLQWTANCIPFIWSNCPLTLNSYWLYHKFSGFWHAHEHSVGIYPTGEFTATDWIKRRQGLLPNWPQPRSSPGAAQEQPRSNPGAAQGVVSAFLAILVILLGTGAV